MPSENEIMLALAKQADTDFSVIGTDAWFATWNARPVDRSRTDENYLAWDRSILSAAETDYWPQFAHGIEKRDREVIEAASVRMSAGLTEIYRRAHIFGGSQHINSPEEEIATWIRSLTARQWNAPERAVLALFMHSGERITEITFHSITTDRDRVLNRVDLPSLVGKRVEDFTSEAVIEKAMIDEARDTEAAKHQPWESNHYVTRNGRHIRLDDIEGRDN
jgi:hypothetical protein